MHLIRHESTRSKCSKASTHPSWVQALPMSRSTEHSIMHKVSCLQTCAARIDNTTVF